MRRYVRDVAAPGSFVHRMATGALEREKYLRYLAQDAYFLFHFNRAYAHALTKAADVETQATFHALIGGVLDELKLHASACERWNVDSSAVEVHDASRAYVEFLESLHDRSMEELVAGMVPCMRLYASVGRAFLHPTDGDDSPDLGGARLEESPYYEWFEAYGSEEMETLARRLESLLPETVEDAVAERYVEAMRLERDFFAAHA